MTATALQEIEVAPPSRKWQRYPAYKPSEMNWVRRLPEHWRVFRLKNIASVRFSTVDKKSEDGETPVRLCNYTDVYNNDRIVDDPEFMQATATAGEIARFTLKKGDVLITKDSEAWNDIAVPAYVTRDMPGVVCGYHLALIRPNPAILDGAYLSRAFEADGIRQQFHVAANGITRYGLPNRAISGALFPVPPLDEQRAIAAFLDRETARIDELIAKKQRLIELLKEKRQAVISRAVTKGLNPTAPMKPSGIDWLGDVPEHWEIAPLYSRYWAELGKMLDTKQITGEHLVPYLRNIDVQWDYFNTDSLPEMDVEPHEYRRFILANGDLVVCEGGEVGRAAIWKGDLPHCAYQKALHRLRPRSKQDQTRFLFYVLCHAAGTGIFVASGNPNTIPHLTGEQLRVYRFPFPPAKEQGQIVEYLDVQIAEYDRLTQNAKTAIDKLREYRSALITAAVTGQIDVRQERREAP